MPKLAGRLRVNTPSAPSTDWITLRPTSTRSAVASMITLATRPGEIDIVRPDGEQHEIEHAIRPPAPRSREILLQLRDLRRHRARAWPVGGAVELARAL